MPSACSVVTKNAATSSATVVTAHATRACRPIQAAAVDQMPVSFSSAAPKAGTRGQNTQRARGHDIQNAQPGAACPRRALARVTPATTNADKQQERPDPR